MKKYLILSMFVVLFSQVSFANHEGHCSQSVQRPVISEPVSILR